MIFIKKQNKNIKICNICNYILLKLLFLNISFSLSLNYQKLYIFKNIIYDSEVIITIKGKGNQPILNNKTIDGLWSMNNNINDFTSLSFNIKPSELLVNNIKINKIDFYVYNLTEEKNNITIKFNQIITNCNVMFYGLTNIIMINLTKFDFSHVISMEYMFARCNNLLSLYLNSFNALSPIYMGFLFKDCSNLISLDLSNFNSSSVLYMCEMFCDCNNLKSLNLSNFFHTSSTINMGHMFSGCKNLISLDLTNFNTSSVIYMDYMFNECNNLISLDLSSFDTSSVTNMKYMFYNCYSLISLDLSNFDTSSISDMNNMFDGCSNNLKFCINNKDNKSNKLVEHINKNNYNFKINNNCSDICFYKNKKIIIDINTCVLNCSNIYKYEYNNICYKFCPNGNHNISDNYCIKDNLDNINNDNNCNNNETSNLYDTTEILDNKDTDLNNNSTLIYSKVYEEYFNECILKDKYCMLFILRNEIKNNTLNLLNIIEKEKKDRIIEEDNIIFQITSPINQNNNEYIDISQIVIGECEKDLRNYYNISNNITLIVLKLDIYEKGLLIPVIEYEIYNSKTKEKLDLTICKNNQINIYIPVSSIDENNLFKYN